ncbi:MAG TPA: phenylalanine--tRNA ligase subunit alpha [Planctomycetia bacterium]|nr:phenylalanine--tRNA ligase subunit alpha [Planctomycetia bacterium]
MIAAGKLDDAKSRFLSQKGEFRQLQSLLGKLPGADKPAFGKVFNEARTEVETAWESARESSGPAKPTGPAFDVLPGIAPPLGARHPLARTIDDIASIFGKMGFALADGPEVEDVFHNFVALNIPEDHPARDPRDNFYIDEGRLLRSQTSTVQIRVMQNQPPPIRVISVGRVYRPDVMDATHSMMFHQVEGLYVDEGVTLADLKTVLRTFTRAYFGPEVIIRFRPSIFPFTEPSIEVDMSWDSTGSKWVELGGAGMVDPNVLEAVKIDPEKYTGFAFGLGVERMAMRRYGVSDIRDFFHSDVRFLRQFI